MRVISRARALPLRPGQGPCSKAWRAAASARWARGARPGAPPTARHGRRKRPCRRASPKWSPDPALLAGGDERGRMDRAVGAIDRAGVAADLAQGLAGSRVVGQVVGDVE